MVLILAYYNNPGVNCIKYIDHNVICIMAQVECCIDQSASKTRAMHFMKKRKEEKTASLSLLPQRVQISYRLIVGLDHLSIASLLLRHFCEAQRVSH